MEHPPCRGVAVTAPSTEQCARGREAQAGPVLSPAQGPLTGGTGDAPLYRAGYGVCLFCRSTNTVNSRSACDPDYFLRNCYLATASPSCLFAED